MLVEAKGWQDSGMCLMEADGVSDSTARDLNRELFELTTRRFQGPCYRNTLGFGLFLNAPVLWGK